MDEEKYWQAVLSRDASMDGEFFYAVRSTGIFCASRISDTSPS